MPVRWKPYVLAVVLPESNNRLNRTQSRNPVIRNGRLESLEKLALEPTTLTRGDDRITKDPGKRGNRRSTVPQLLMSPLKLQSVKKQIKNWGTVVGPIRETPPPESKA
jgi:hypothetical protein